MWLDRARRISLWIVAGLALVLGSPIVPWVVSQLADRWDAPRGDVLVVLGADMLGDGTIGLGSYWRSIYGVRAYRQHRFKRVIVCGGPGAGARPVAEAMAEFMGALGVPREVMVIESRSSSTRENALYAKELAGVDKVVLVTGDFHMWRSRRVFEHVGLQVASMPFPDVGKRWSVWPQRVQCVWEVGSELMKIGYYRVKGWI